MTIDRHQRIMCRWPAVTALALLSCACGIGGGRGGSLAAAAKYEAKGQFRATYIESKKILQHDSQNGMAWLLLGKATLMLGNPQDAVNDLQNAKAHGVASSQWSIPLGRALLVTRQFDTFLKTISPNDASSSDDKARILGLQGDAYLDLKQTNRAKQSYQAALALESANPHALVGLAKLAASDSDMDSARKYVQQAIAAAPDDMDAWMFKGDMAFNTGDYASAEADYEKALGSKSLDVLPQQRFYATARLADAQIRQNKLDTALTHIATLEKMSPGQPYPHYLHAVLDYKRGQYGDAISQLQLVLKAVPNSEPAQLLMGAVNYAQKDFSQAEMNLSNVLGLDQHNAAARKLLALTLYKEGQPQQALKVLRPAVGSSLSDAALLALMQKNAAEGIAPPGTMESTPGSAGGPADAQFDDIRRALAADHPDEAIHLLKALPASNAQFEGQRYAMLVVAYLQAKRTNDAVQTAEEYVRKNPKLSDAHDLYGTALAAANKRREARAEYTKAHQLDPWNISALLSLGSLDVFEKRNQEALAQYQSVLQIDPDNIAALLASGRVTAAMGEHAQAADWFKRAIKAAPKSVDPYVDLIALYSSGGQFEDAVAVARNLEGIAPHDPRALNAVAVAELGSGKYRDALVPLQQAVSLAPNVALYRTNLARTQILNGQSKQAQANLEQVYKAVPEDVQAVSLLAMLKLKSNDMSGALSLARGLQVQTQTRVAGLSLEGDLYMEKKQYTDAAHAYQRALKLDYARPLVIKLFMAANAGASKDADRGLLSWLDRHPDDAVMRMLLGEYYMNRAQYDLSDRQFQRVLKDYPNNVAVLNNLAWVYTLQNNSDAVSLAERAHTLAPNSAAVSDTYAWALIVNGHADKALPILQQAVKQAPEMPTIRYHLAVAQARTGHKAEALESLQLVLKPGTTFPERTAAEKLYRDLGASPH